MVDGRGQGSGRPRRATFLSQKFRDKVTPFRVAVPQPRQGRKVVAQGGRAAFSPRWVSNLGSSGGGPGPTRIILFLTLERSGGSLLELSQDSAGKRRQGKAKGTRQGGKAGEIGKRY